MFRRLLGAMICALACSSLSTCGEAFSLDHTERPGCLHPGETVTLGTTAPPGTRLVYRVQDDFGGDISPGLPPASTDSSGRAVERWTAPASASTTVLHFLLTATHGADTVRRDVHVRLRRPGDPC